MEQRLLAVYRRLLASYPADFRRDFGADMLQVLGDQLRDRGPAEQLAVFSRALADLAQTAPRERLTAVRAQPAQAGAGAGGAAVVSVPPVRQTTGPSRRDFLRGALVMTGAGLGSAVAGASLAFLWPDLRGGFGAKIDIGTPADVAAGITASGGTFPVPAARAYLVSYDPTDDAEGLYADIAGGTPFMALYQRCVHLGCRVPWCTSSTRFECPCHKSRYNRWGEYQDGPAPRGLDRFAVAIVEGKVIVDTATTVTGPPRQGGALTEGPSGPSCVAAS